MDTGIDTQNKNIDSENKWISIYFTLFLESSPEIRAYKARSAI